MEGMLKITGIGLCLSVTICLYLLTYSIFSNIHAQEDKRVTNGTSTSYNTIQSFPPREVHSKITALSGNSSNDIPGASNSTQFLKYNNLGNNENKAGSISYNYPSYSDPASAYMQPFFSSPTNSLYNPYYSQRPYSSGIYPSSQLTQPYYYPNPQTLTPFSTSLNSASPTYPYTYPPFSGLPVQPYQYLPSASPPPPPPVFPPPRYTPEIMQGPSLAVNDQKSEGPVELEESKMVSPWFPSVPASECEGIFEFTVEGTAELLSENLKSGNHKITIKMSSGSSDTINGQLWIDKKTSGDKGSKFDIDKTFNNCRVVTASALPPTTGQKESSSSLLNSLLDDLPDSDYSTEDTDYSTEDTDYSTEDQSKDEADNTDKNLQEEEAENSDSIEKKGKSEIAAFE
jgi:hypothetical protein